MKHSVVIERILSALDVKDLALFNVGLNSRTAYSINDRKCNFYMVGSMGLVSSVGLGLAINCKRKVFILPLVAD